MASPYTIEIESTAAMRKQITDLGDSIDVVARQAVNRVIDRTRTMASREIRSQVNFEAAYLDSQEGRAKRLGVTKRASGNKLEATITARHRATSLARFSETVAPGLATRTGGVRVQVKPGSTKAMKRAFFIKLRQGKSDVTDTRFNLGLAIRLKPGEKLNNKLKVQELSRNLYLLYGPSVDQVFRTVAPELAPKVLPLLENEFNRLMEVKNRGR